MSRRTHAQRARGRRRAEAALSNELGNRALGLESDCARRYLERRLLTRASDRRGGWPRGLTRDAVREAVRVLLAQAPDPLGARYQRSGSGTPARA